MQRGKMMRKCSERWRKSNEDGEEKGKGKRSNNMDEAGEKNLTKQVKMRRNHLTK